MSFHSRMQIRMMSENHRALKSAQSHPALLQIFTYWATLKPRESSEVERDTPQGTWTFSEGEAAVHWRLGLRRESWEIHRDSLSFCWLHCRSMPKAEDRAGKQREIPQRNSGPTPRAPQQNRSLWTGLQDRESSAREQNWRAKRTPKWPRKLEGGR